MTPNFVYGTAWKEDRTAELVTAALHAGFRAIDTANQRKHYHEAGVGEALADAYRKKLVSRGDLWLQTKFTYIDGQDHRLPYDPSASLADQVAQSMASSLDHLGTTYVDSYVLHGPASGRDWTDHDDKVWRAMMRERKVGRARVLGVSNVRLHHLKVMPEEPAFVQNRCFARQGWDREVRAWCREQGVIYQGFSLLTANPEIFRHPLLHQLAAEHRATLPQIVFAFSRAVGMLPLTGTTDAEHMQQDLASLAIELAPEHVAAIEALVA